MKKRLFFRTIIAMTLLGLAWVQVASGEVADSGHAADGSEQRGDGVGKLDYILGQGDILDIVVWKEPDFSREGVRVRMDGKITLPLIDDIQAAGTTTMALKNRIETRLKKFMGTPVVTVIVNSPVSQKFYILGEVAQAGEYSLVKGLNVLQAFAMAGGFTEWASKKHILLIRREKGGPNQVIKIDYKKILKGVGLEQNVSVQADDTIIVP